MNLLITQILHLQKNFAFCDIPFAFICKQSVVANAQGIPGYIPAYGLLAWYPFNDNPNDESGYGHNGVPYGYVIYGTDRFGMPDKCYQSNGNGYIDVPVNNFPIGNASRSITGFFKCQLPYISSTSGGRDIITWGSNSFGTRFTLYTTPTTIGAEYTNGAVLTSFTPDSAWHNITVTYYTGGTDSLKLYFDGLIVSSYAINPIGAFSTDTGLRHSIAGTIYYIPPYADSWIGEVDDIGVWNRALTPCEVWDIWIGATSFIPVISVSGSVLSTANNYTGYQWIENGSAIPGATNASYTATVSGSYQVSVTDSGGCPGTSADTLITVINYVCDTISLSDSLHACKNTTLSLNAGVTGPNAVINVAWSPASGLSNPGILNPLCTVSALPLSYTLTVQALMPNGDTCTTSKSVYIAVSELSSTICGIAFALFKEISFTASDSGITGATFSWNFGDNVTATGTPVLHTYGSYGSYNVKLTETDSYGCKDSTIASVPVTPNLNLVLNVSHDTTVCGQQNLQLMVTGADSAYIWSPAAGLSNAHISNPIASIDSTIKYIVTGFDSGLCMGTDSVTIHFTSGPVVKASGNSAICYGQYDQLNASGAVTYSWYPADYITDAGIANPLVHPILSTTYIVTGADSNGCKGEDSIHVNVLPLPVLTVSSSGTVSCSDTAVQLAVTGAATYLWSPAAYIVNDDVHSSNPFVSPLGNTVFWVTGTDPNGCSNTDSILVTSDKSATVFVPTAFTPNNDGLDDVIFPRVYCDLIFDQFSIYNRWGQQVFTTKAEGVGWDGKFHGVPQPIGSFDYFVKGHKKSNGKAVLFKGSFTLIR